MKKWLEHCKMVYGLSYRGARGITCPSRWTRTWSALGSAEEIASGAACPTAVMWQASVAIAVLLVVQKDSTVVPASEAAQKVKHLGSQLVALVVRQRLLELERTHSSCQGQSRQLQHIWSMSLMHQ